jgi:hypothetical protein
MTRGKYFHSHSILKYHLIYGIISKHGGCNCYQVIYYGYRALRVVQFLDKTIYFNFGVCHLIQRQSSMIYTSGRLYPRSVPFCIAIPNISI